MNKKFIVYKHTSPNNKVYIGITSQSPNNRWRNGNGYKTNMYFTKAIKKYGWDNFKHEIIEIDLSLEEACAKEKYYINLYNSHNPNYGYNLTDGGEGVAGYKMSAEQKQHLSKIRLGTKFSKESREKMSLNRTGKLNSFYGKHHSEVSKQKMSISKKGKSLSEEHKRKVSENHYYKGKFGVEHNRSISCLCVETNQIFGSIREAEREMNIDRSTIIRCCKGKSYTAGGYHWKYVDKENGLDSTFNVVIN